MRWAGGTIAPGCTQALDADGLPISQSPVVWRVSDGRWWRHGEPVVSTRRVQLKAPSATSCSRLTVNVVTRFTVRHDTSERYLIEVPYPPVVVLDVSTSGMQPCEDELPNCHVVRSLSRVFLMPLHIASPPLADLAKWPRIVIANISGLTSPSTGRSPADFLRIAATHRCRPAQQG